MDRIEEQIRERLGELISAQMAIYTNKEKDVWPFIEHRDALRTEIADDWRAMVEACKEGLDLLYGLTQWIPNDEQAVLERMYAAIAKARGE